MSIAHFTSLWLFQMIRICEIPSICQMRMHLLLFSGQGKTIPGITVIHFSVYWCSCQTTLTHSTTHDLKGPCQATRWLVSSLSLVSDWEQMFGSLCESGESQEARCEGQKQVRLGVAHCGHMIQADQVFRTSTWATPGSIWEQSTNLGGLGWGHLLYGI